jgi:FMN phosphatase YigB (HAD superfamily)
MKAVLFDLGHTLIDYYDDWKVPEDKAVAEVSTLVSKTGGPRVDEAAVARFLKRLLEEGREVKLREEVESPLEDVLERCFVRFSRDGGKTLKEACLQTFYGMLLEDRHVVAGAPQMLRKVRELGYHIGLVSDVAWGLPSRFPLQDMRFYGLDRFFDDMVFSTDVGLRKPNPEIFRMELARVGATPEEALFVGNNLQADIKGALDVGMRAVLKKSQYYVHDDSIVPTARIAEWNELLTLLE